MYRCSVNQHLIVLNIGIFSINKTLCMEFITVINFTQFTFAVRYVSKVISTNLQVRVFKSN